MKKEKKKKKKKKLRNPTAADDLITTMTGTTSEPGGGEETPATSSFALHEGEGYSPDSVRAAEQFIVVSKVSRPRNAHRSVGRDDRSRERAIRGTYSKRRKN